MSGDEITIERREAPNRTTDPGAETLTSALGGMDEELKAMKDIAMVLLPLEASARGRVIRWISDHMVPVKYGTTPLSSI